jgi:hypothetical protein
MKGTIVALSLLLSSATILCSNVLGQEKTSGLLWLDFNYSKFVTPDLSFGGDGGYRVNLSSTSWHSIYARPTVKYRFNSTFTLTGSIAGFQEFNGDSPNTFEFRGAQQITANWQNTKNLRFINRLRLEERWFFYEGEEEVESSSQREWSPRLRYMLRVESAAFNVGELFRNIYLHGSIEYFLGLGAESDERYFNQSRIIAGWGQLLKNNRKYEVDLMWQQSRNTLEGNFDTDQFVVRLRYFLKQLPSREA